MIEPVCPPSLTSSSPSLPPSAPVLPAPSLFLWACSSCLRTSAFPLVWNYLFPDSYVTHSFASYSFMSLLWCSLFSVSSSLILPHKTEVSPFPWVISVPLFCFTFSITFNEHLVCCMYLCACWFTVPVFPWECKQGRLFFIFCYSARMAPSS